MVQELRDSEPVSCQTIQSAASIQRAQAAYTCGSSSRTWSAFAYCHSAEIRPPYRLIQGSPRWCARALTRSAWSWAAWCFQSFGHAWGRSAQAGCSASGTPSAVVGSTVQEVKSVPMAMTRAGSTPAAASASGTAVLSASRQSRGSWRAQSGGNGVSEPGRLRSMTPLR